MFTGPTLDHERAAGIIDAELEGPITVDDLPRALADGIDVVGIIDGAFVQRYSATPTQILECLRAGMVVYGAASAGALRAVEAARFGMRGVGVIYERFARGFLAEDELLMSYDPDTLRPLSVPMINVRHATRLATEAGVIDEGVRRTLNRIAKEQYFAERSYRSIVTASRDHVDESIGTQFLAWVEHQGDAVDLKRSDAIRCLEVMAAT